MGPGDVDRFSAGEQGLGYIYQSRLALLKLVELAESTSILIEKDDDLDLIDKDGRKSLASLKHKAAGGRLTDLSIDFWKSVRIWLNRYERDGRTGSNLQFFLFTTDTISGNSFLKNFADQTSTTGGTTVTLSTQATEALDRSSSPPIQSIATEFNRLSTREKEDFLSRIKIFDGSPRIVDVPTEIKERYMRTVRREFRGPVFERLEGWWSDTVVKLLAGERTEPVFGYEVSDKLSAIAAEYKADNLPITFRGREPEGGIDAENDPRLFVVQLRAIAIGPNRIRSAILDYYRAFEQRSAWAREALLVADEIEEYEDRIVEEWGRFKDVAFERLDDQSAETALTEAGRAVYQWVELESGNVSSLRIRPGVTEPYVLRGAFHILANEKPEPRVHWHPHFLSRIGELLGVTE